MFHDASASHEDSPSKQLFASAQNHRANQWLHLTNEAYAAEKFGVRALTCIAKKKSLSRSFESALALQIDDEVSHTRGYAKFVRALRLPPSSFSDSVEDLLNGLDSVTLRLFVLQGLVEGLNVGLLQHRLETWRSFPSRSLEEEALRDELQHTCNSYGFMRELHRLEGTIPQSHFDGITGRILRLFSEETASKSTKAYFDAVNQVQPHVVPWGGRSQKSSSSAAHHAISTMRRSRRDFLQAYKAQRDYSEP